MSNQFAETLKEPATARRTGMGSYLVRRLRWLAKEVLFFVYLYCGYVQLRDAVLSFLGRSRVTVLYYHRVGGLDVLTKPSDEFRSDVEYLKKNYECIGLALLCARLRINEPFRRRAAVITFDDGYRDNFTEAFPILQKAGVTATFFVATGFIGTEREFPHDSRDAGGSERTECLAKLAWQDLRAMQAAGFEIGSHTVNHTNLGRADQQTIENEVRESLAALNRELGEQPRAFSFPWGKPGDISRRAIDEVKRSGYYSAVSAYGGSNSRSSDAFSIRRIDVGNGEMSRLAVRAKIAGFDPEYGRINRVERYK